MVWYVQETETLPQTHTDLDAAMGLAKYLAETNGNNYAVLELLGERRPKPRESEFVNVSKGVV
jgi:hypothetical protein